MRLSSSIERESTRTVVKVELAQTNSKMGNKMTPASMGLATPMNVASRANTMTDALFLENFTGGINRLGS